MNAESGRSFATLTHARLRAAQGDVKGALRILRVILEVQPGHDAARELVGEIETLASVGHSETAEHAVEAVTPATTGDLARRFRDALGGRSAGGPVSRLVSWLERMRRNRGERRDR